MTSTGVGAEITDANPRGLGTRASSSAAVAAAGQAIRFVLQTTGIVVLAHLLYPDDYGVLAVAVAIAGFGEMFRDFGLAYASVQAATLSRAERDNLFWANTALGVLLALVALAAAPVTGTLFGDPRIGHVLAVLSVGFVLNAIGTQPRASLVRSMRFMALNVVDSLGLALGLMTGIGLAASGAGYICLPVMLVVQNLGTLIGTLAAAGWLPGRPRRSVSIRPFIGFGAALFGSQFLSLVTRNASTFVIGVTLGVTPLGLYNRSYQLLNLPLAQLQVPATQIALPVLSRLRDDPERFQRFLLRGQSILLHATTAVLALTAGVATPLFAVALGHQWLPAAPVYQILALAGFTMVANYASNWVYLAEGKTRSQLRLSLITQPATLVSVLIGAHFGLYGIVGSFALINALLWPFSMWWLSRASSVPVGALMANGARAIGAYGTAGLAAWMCTLDLQASELVEGLAGTGVFLCVLATWIAVWPKFRQELLDIAQTARLLRAER